MKPNNAASQSQTNNPWVMIHRRYNDPGPNDQARYDAVEQLEDEFSFATMEDTGELYVYNPELGIYEPHGERTIKQRLSNTLREHYSTGELNQIRSQIEGRSYCDREDFGASADDPKVCLSNGVLDLRTRELTPHNPEHKFFRALPVAYDPDAESPRFDRFLDDITGRSEDKRVLCEMIGYCLWPAYDYRAFLVLYGDGANGKSTFFEVVERFIGEENVSNCTLQQLASDRFAKADLYEKLANIAPDLPDTKLTDTGAVKELTGEDTSRAEKKYKPAFEFTNRATLMFGANQLPDLGDPTPAIADRLIPIHLPYRFTNEDDANPDARSRSRLVAEMTTDEELSGILNMALDGLDRLRRNDGFTLSDSPEERLARYQQEANPIHRFADECLTNEPKRQVRKSVVYDAYKQWADEHGYEIEADSIFHRELGKYPALELMDSRPTRNDKRVRVYDDLIFTDDGRQFTDRKRTFEEENTRGQVSHEWMG
jgi:putative DNA primase/helicase